MPTIMQLPLAVTVGPTDQLPIAQSGQTMSVSVATLTAGTQPKLTLAPGALLGRASSGPGGPEPIGVGPGLVVNGGQIAADATLARVSSPAFTGTPTAPTPAAGDRSGALATTAFVHGAMSGGGGVTNAISGTITLTGDVVGAGTDTIATSLATILAPGTFTKVTVNGKGQVVAGAATTAADIGDGSGLPVTATGTTTARTLAVRAVDILNALDFGAVGDGVTRAGAAISAAIAAAAAKATGGEVFIPAGSYRIDLAVAAVVAKSGVRLRGAGRGRTLLLVDDANGTGGTNANAGIANAVGSTISDFHLRDLTLTGTRGQTGGNITQGPFLLNLVNVQNISVENCEFTDSRGFSLGIFSGSDVMVRGNRVLRSNIDSIAVWDVADVTITGNEIAMSGDDSISVHASDGSPSPLRSGIIVTDNIITDGQGIHILGAKTAVVSGNVIRRSRPHGINVGYDTLFHQGNTPNFGIEITDNVIEDIIDTSIFGGSSGAFYILVGGASKQAGPGASAPGTPVVGTGVVTPLYGSGMGIFYAAGGQSDSDGVFTTTGTIASPGGHFIRIEGNILVRTLPSVTSYSQWGYASTLQVGKHGVYNGPITEAMLGHPGIHLQYAQRNCRIAGNIIQTTGANGIEFDAIAGDLDYDGLEIAGNRISDFSGFGVAWLAGTGSTQRIRLIGNDFDGDPYFRNAGRGAGGTWAAAGAGCIGVGLGLLSGVELEGNHFRNLVAPVVQGSGVVNVLRANVVHGRPVAVGFDPGNAGVGTVPVAAGDFSHVIETSDPADANYGKMFSPTLFSNPVQPSSGVYVTGAFVATTMPALAGGGVFLGWKRLTTGAAHVSGVDWTPVFGASGAAAQPVAAVSTVYATSGAIAPSDNLALVNATGPVAMTLGAGPSAGHQLIVKRYGAGAVTLTTSIDGTAGSALTLNAAGAKESVTLNWYAAAATWLLT